MKLDSYRQLELVRRFWVLVGAEISITDPFTNVLVGYVKMKAWRLREDIRIYADRSQNQELLRITARQIIDFGATYDAYDSTTDTLLFSLRRKGLKSTFVRDHWEVLSPSGTPIAAVQETSSQLALMRRYIDLIPLIGPIIGFIFLFIPQSYAIYTQNSDGTTRPAATLTHRKNPLLVKMSIVNHDTATDFDSRITITASTLLMVIDASKN